MKAGELTVMTDAENLGSHKMRIRDRDLGQLVRVDEVPEKQVEKLFKDLEEAELSDGDS